MFNFRDAVNTLLEAEPNAAAGTPTTSTTTPSQGNQPVINPPAQNNGNDAQNIMKSEGFKNLINTYAFQYKVGAPNVNEILKAANIVTGGGYIAKKYTNIGYIPFIDAFAQAYTAIKDNNKSKYTQSAIINAIVQDPSTFDPIFNKIAENIKTTTSVQDYEPADPDVRNAWQSLMAETNKLSQTAIQSLGSDSVHSAIVKIIAKRIPVLDRVMGLKGLVKPFNKSVITPILYQFKKYTGYKQGDAKKNPYGWLKDRLWPKKVPGDFSKMVEDISANNLLNVAVLAYEYYIYLLSTQGKPLYPQQPVNASLNKFDNFIGNILNEETPPWMQGPSAYQPQQAQKAPTRQRDYKAEYARRKELKAQRNQKTQNQQPQQSTGSLPAEQIEKISNLIGTAPDADYTTFLDDGESRYLPGIKYNLSTIARDPSREAKALYKALTDMAFFVRPRLSAAQRISRAVGAVGALHSGIGPVN